MARHKGKDLKKILKTAKEGKMYVTFKQTEIRSTAVFSPEMMETRRHWNVATEGVLRRSLGHQRGKASLLWGA